jgi:hypothetical protein
MPQGSVWGATFPQQARTQGTLSVPLTQLANIDDAQRWGCRASALTGLLSDECERGE